MPATRIEECVDRIPPTEELRELLSKNLRERDLLRRMLRLAEQKEKLRLNEEEFSDG